MDSVPPVDSTGPTEHSGLLKFLNAAPVGLVQLALNGDVQLINGASAQLLLPLAGERNLDNLFDALADHAPALRQQAASFSAPHGAICQDLHLTVQHPPERRQPMQVIALTLLKLDPQQLLATLTDITEQVLMAQALRASELRLGLAMDALSLADWELDLRSGDIRRSPQHDRLFGHPQPLPQWRLTSLLRQVHSEDLAAVSFSLQTAISTTSDWRCEFRVVWPDASVHWLSAHGHVDTRAGLPGRLVCILADSTVQRLAAAEHQRAEDLAEENRRVLEANHLKSQFIANMSHELRTPLNAIIGFAELLKRGAVPPGSPKQQDFLGHIAGSGHHLLKLINEVLDLAKVESGKLEFQPEIIDLPVLVAEVLAALEPGIQAKSLSTRTDLDPALQHGLYLDPVRFKQVLFNFLSNAIKFTPEGGRVALRALPAGPDHVRIEVEDDGIGIPAEQLGQLFVEFHQLDGGHDKAHHGTGLGLALTRRLVEAQGGQVGVHSSPGLSTTFHAVLNRVHGHDAERAAGRSVPAGAVNDRLLVIEHDPQRRADLVRGLTSPRRQVDSAADAEQAWRRGAASPYDAITLDLLLPERAGLPTLGRLRDGGASQHAAVVGLTLPTDGGEAASFAITNLLCKPIRTDEVLRALSRLRSPGALSQPALRVLVVDDDPLAGDLMQATLSSIGAQAIVIAQSGEALAALEREQPDALILDLMMPGMDGFQVLHAVRSQPAWVDLPVFIWTSMMLTEAEYATLGRSAQSILAKGGAGLTDMIDALKRGWQNAAPSTSV